MDKTGSASYSDHCIDPYRSHIIEPIEAPMDSFREPHMTVVLEVLRCTQPPTLATTEGAGRPKPEELQVWGLGFKSLKAW